MPALAKDAAIHFMNTKIDALSKKILDSVIPLTNNEV